MKTRLALIVLLLVVLPTAILSFLSGRVLRNWETILQRRLETSAAAAVWDVSSRINTKLEEALDEVRVVMADSLARGGNIPEMAHTAARLEQSSRMVDQVYVFMSPMGFVYPERAGEGSGSRSGGVGQMDRLAEALRTGNAPEEGRAGPRFVVVEDSIYCFAPLRNRRGLYAGFRVNPDAFNRHLATVMNWLSGDDFVLCARGPGLGSNEDVMVSDSFSSAPESTPDDRPAPGGILMGRAGAGRLVESGAAIYSARLTRPFDFIEVSAYAEDVDKFRRAGAWQVKLYGWGIALVAAAVLAGAWLIVRQAAAEIQRARQRSDFMMGVSHDLRTPISSMKVLAESLYLDYVPEPEKRKRFLGTIVAECDRLADMIERVLFFVRQEQNAVQYTPTPMDPATLLRSVAGTFAERVGFRVRDKEMVDGGGGRTDVPADRESGTAGDLILDVRGTIPMVNGDWEALAKVVFNLLDNARKYSGTAAGLAVPSRIEVRLAAGESRGRPGVTIAFMDNGVGIPRSEWRRIFKRFYRGNSPIHRSVGGVGLGLSLCRDIVRAHRGEIGVESDLGKGSTFTVWLPAESGKR